MLSKEIEKEIQQENKVLLNFTLRQVVCLSVAILCSVIIAVFLQLDFSISIYPCMVIGAVCFAFGWVKQDGMPMEQLLLRRLRIGIYQNQTKVYKTKNRYVTMFNQEYAHRRMVDSKDKKVKRDVRRDARAAKRLQKSSKFKRIL